eukprot:7783769-Ditylum_brightwellii.AAC.1
MASYVQPSSVTLILFTRMTYAPGVYLRMMNHLEPATGLIEWQTEPTLQSTRCDGLWQGGVCVMGKTLRHKVGGRHVVRRVNYIRQLYGTLVRNANF